MIRLMSLLAAATCLAAPLNAQSIAITGAKLVVGDGSPPIDNGVVLIENGRVVAAGAPGAVMIPQGATSIAAQGKWVTPGLVVPFSRIGLSEVDLSAPGSDDSDVGDTPYSAAVDVSWSVNPSASPIAYNRADGITRAAVAPSPSDRIFGGRGAIIDTGADYDPIMQDKAFQLIELGENGAGRSGGSRSVAFLVLQQALDAARRGTLPDGPDAARLTQADIDALGPVVRGDERLMVRVNRASDIINVIKLKNQYPALDLILMQASEGWLVAREIAAAGIPVIAEPTWNRPGSFEQLASTQSNIGRLRAAGVDVSVAVLSDFVTRNAFNQRQMAGNLVALTRVPGHDGVEWDMAFHMISGGPAAMYDLDAGTLQPGKRADVVIWSGDPLEVGTHAERVWIDGIEQDLSTRQDKLRERYRTLERGRLPEAYRR